MNKGIYTMILRLDSDMDLTAGALGQISLCSGYYAYTGSARGPGGLKRLERHLRVMDGTNSARRWHIDYLLPHTSLVKAVVTETELDLECQIARSIGESLDFVPRFGCSDCKCPSHLHFCDDKNRILKIVGDAHASSTNDIPADYGKAEDDETH